MPNRDSRYAMHLSLFLHWSRLFISYEQVGSCISFLARIVLPVRRSDWYTMLTGVSAEITNQGMRPSVRFLYCPCRWAVPLPGSFRRGELYTGPRAILVRDCEPIKRVHVNIRHGLIWRNVKSANQHSQSQSELGIGKASGCQNIFRCASGPERWRCLLDSQTLSSTLGERDQIFIQIFPIVGQPSIWVELSGVAAPDRLIEVNGVGGDADDGLEFLIRDEWYRKRGSWQTYSFWNHLPVDL